MFNDFDMVSRRNTAYHIRSCRVLKPPETRQLLEVQIAFACFHRNLHEQNASGMLHVDVITDAMANTGYSWS